MLDPRACYHIQLLSIDYQLAESLNLELDYDDEESDFRKTNFPGRYIYERLLPEIVSAHCDIFYHRGSPYSGNGKPTTDRTFGDLHQCVLFLVCIGPCLPSPLL